VAIEELEDLNCDLSAVIEPSAQLRRAEFPVRRLGGEFGKEMPTSTTVPRRKK
jgi:hypothetical protein